MSTLDELVRDLLDRWTGDEERPGDGGPGLIPRLDELALRTAQPRQAGGRSTPGSRPPGSLDAVHWATAIKAQARILDMELRASAHMQRWDRALKALPAGAEATGRVGEVASTVGRWHSTCRTILGLQAPSRLMRGVVCLVCGTAAIHCRPDDDRPRAWCVNPGCVDEDTGRPARYEGSRLYLLTTSRAPAR
ncbi:hypothetical protein [Streptomyces sp. NPDC002328]|uniref:DUF7341 domain-containing protein n=1 Tax=Streptomyces sp. NPDC002328 TaxID=3364642 RepID=UPI0036B0B508